MTRQLIFCTTTVLLLLLSTFSTGQNVHHSQTAENGDHDHPMAYDSFVDEDHSCRTRSDCFPKYGLRSVCNNYGRCVCQMGFREVLRIRNGTLVESGGKITCEHLDCESHENLCKHKFGRSHCQIGRCVCDSGYEYNIEQQECTKIGGDWNNERHTNPSYLLIFGLADGGLVLIVFLIVLICCCLKRKNKKIEERKQAVARDRAAHAAQQAHQIPTAPLPSNANQQQHSSGAYI